MRRSSNSLVPGQNFTIRVTQKPDGKFEASSPNAPKVGAVTANSRQVAVSQMGKRLTEAQERGEIGNE